MSFLKKSGSSNDHKQKTWSLPPKPAQKSNRSTQTVTSPIASTAKQTKMCKPPMTLSSLKSTSMKTDNSITEEEVGLRVWKQTVWWYKEEQGSRCSKEQSLLWLGVLSRQKRSSYAQNTSDKSHW